MPTANNVHLPSSTESVRLVSSPQKRSPFRQCPEDRLATFTLFSNPHMTNRGGVIEDKRLIGERKGSLKVRQAGRISSKLVLVENIVCTILHALPNTLKID